MEDMKTAEAEFNSVIKELEAKWKSVKKKDTAFDKPVRYKCPVCKEYTPCELYGAMPAPYNNPIYKCKQCGVLYGT
jgi:hypothetical protein